MKPDWVKYLRNLAEGQKKQVPDHIWLEVSKHLPEKSRKKRIIPWIWFLGGLLFSSGLIYLFWPKTEYDSNAFKVIENQQIFKETQIAIHEEVSQDKGQVFENASPSSLPSLLPPAASLSSKASVYNFSNTSLEKRKKLSIKGSEKFNQTHEVVEFNSRASENNISLEHNTTHQKTPEVLEEGKGFAMIGVIPYLPVYHGMLINEDNLFKLPVLGFEAVGKTDCYQFGKKSTELGLEVYSGPSYSPYHLKDKQDGFENFIQKRTSSESIRPGIMAGVRMVYQKSSWAVKLGLEYQLFYEQLNYRNPDETQIISVYRDGNYFTVIRSSEIGLFNITTIIIY